MNLQGFLFWLWLLMPICWLMGMGSRQQGKKSCVISTFCARSIAQPQCWAWIETNRVCSAIRAGQASPSLSAGRGLKRCCARQIQRHAEHRPASVLGVD